MALETTPLLGTTREQAPNDPDSALSIDSAKHPHWFRRLTARRNVLPFFLTLVATLAISLAIILLTIMDRPVPRNVVFMISDGMGPASLSLARSFMQYTEDLEFNAQLPLDLSIIGTSRTRSHDSLVTDSAAGATAFACTLKTYNRAIGMNPLGRPCGTILEAAKRQGYLTGLVVTSKITDATPACFATHVLDRDFENEIAEQLLGAGPLNRTVDLIFGGGRCHFLPETHSESCRLDNKDLIAEALEQGYTYVPDRNAFDALDETSSVNLPLLGLFSPGHMAYTIDHDPSTEPSLAEMTQSALSILHAAARKSKTGFFLLVEGSRIDMAAHSNDPAAHVHDVLAFNEAFRLAKRFVDQVPRGGLVISTSDHETGGLSVGRQINETYPEYIWYPQVLANVSHSTEYLGLQVARNTDTHHGRVRKFIEDTIVKDGLGVHDATAEEIEKLMSVRTSAMLTDFALADMWATHGHSASDVNIYAAGDPVLEKLRGNHENTEIGKFVRDYLDLDLEAVTRILNSGGNATVYGQTKKGSVRKFGRDYHHGLN